MGEFDLPALLNTTLQVSGQERLYYVGHSMGTTAFLVMANKHPGIQFYSFVQWQDTINI
jgi:lysosomal acid lipase/cholesteryl ester hydrolase